MCSSSWGTKSSLKQFYQVYKNVSQFSHYKKVEITNDIKHLTWGLMVRVGAVGYVTSYHMGRHTLVFDREDPANDGKLVRSDSTRDHTVITEADNFRWLDQS